VDEEKALKDMAQDLSFGSEILALCQEFNDGDSLEAQISRDADQLDLILELKEQLDLGNRYASDWLGYAIERLHTESARKMAQESSKPTVPVVVRKREGAVVKAEKS
jgi:putative hydrolase of HD superfamily